MIPVSTAFNISSGGTAACQPPYSNPPALSSSGPPGACMTPSMVMNVVVMIFLICSNVIKRFLYTCSKIRDQWDDSKCTEHHESDNGKDSGAEEQLPNAVYSCAFRRIRLVPDRHKPS